jgi:hypothetical protein
MLINSSNNLPTKYNFNLSEDAVTIYNRLLVYLKEESNFDYQNNNLNNNLHSGNQNLLKNLLKENLETFYVSPCPSLINSNSSPSNLEIKNSQQFIQNLSTEYLTIFMLKYGTHSQIVSDVLQFPLLKYIGALRNIYSHKLTFTIKFVPDSLTETHDTLILLLFDQNNNPMVKLFITLPSNLKKCSEIITYLEHIILTFYPNSNFTPENFYFLIQHSRGTFAYDIFHDREQALFQYRHNRDLCIEYRLQPFINEDISMFHSSSNCKLFVTLVGKDGGPACDPIILFIDKESTVIQIKRLLVEKMNLIKKLVLSYGEINLTKIKFYTYSLQNYRPQKEILLLNSKDEEPLISYFKAKNSAHNLLVEFLIGVSEESIGNNLGYVMNHSFLETGHSLSVDTSNYRNNI